MSGGGDATRGPHGDAGAGEVHARASGPDAPGAHGERSAAPRPAFRSYYGRPVLKPPVWRWEIPAYLFTGGLSAGSALLAAGADLTGRPVLRRAGRLGGFAALAASTGLLIADLGRPERFHHMLRVAKPSSPMSVGTWILVAYGPGSALAAAAELLPAPLRARPPGRLLWRAARPAGLSAAALAPPLAAYTAVLLSQTAVPAWHDAHRQLPFLFTGSAAASASGLGMLAAPPAEASPARRLAVLGTAAEIVAARLIERRPGLVPTAYTTGRAGRLRLAAEGLTLAGALAAGSVARRSRPAAVAAGLALLAGSALQRFAVFAAGVSSTEDPAYVVVPQRERLDAAAAGREEP
ncbi:MULTISPECIES: NrfD/PsrC family molybdoenzyme membrane anchor subunit [Streptomyces]|uniref:NrfD/PsrC family molybdoenzyme membrane anchor subunit n=1 Tax=Streptomyces TaxID=1883 RepID=UPI00083539C9|nr:MULTISPECIES: NrfD/PsrC family molybdoenzyme membrane anchor subunit [Streptomyces]MDN5383455.1 polysulfide reductase NrfD [Streptomyces sp. LB8]